MAQPSDSQSSAGGGRLRRRRQRAGGRRPFAPSVVNALPVTHKAAGCRFYTKAPPPSAESAVGRRQWAGGPLFSTTDAPDAHRSLHLMTRFDSNRASRSNNLPRVHLGQRHLPISVHRCSSVVDYHLLPPPTAKYPNRLTANHRQAAAFGGGGRGQAAAFGGVGSGQVPAFGGVGSGQAAGAPSRPRW
jgi:hypothetical protein